LARYAPYGACAFLARMPREGGGNEKFFTEKHQIKTVKTDKGNMSRKIRKDKTDKIVKGISF